MTERNLFHRLAGFRALGVVAALAGLTIFWACHLNSTDSQDHFDLQADSTWAKCDSLTVILEDTSGTVIDTLFNDTLVSLSQLSNLSADKYTGGKARVRIVGHKNGGLCVEQTRSFDDHGGPVFIDTVALPGAVPKSVEITPATLEISVGDPSVEVKATIKPAFADQAFEWSVEDASIATIDFPNGANGGRILVIPQKNGTVRILARAKQDTSKSAELVVHVGSVSGKTISLSPDTLHLYIGGPDSAFTANVSPEGSDVAIAWSSVDEKIAKVDSKGSVTAIGVGATRIKAKFGDAAALADVLVKLDVPVLTVASKSGAGVNVPIVFSPKATQEFGSIVMFKWDLLGDGEWDDSLPGPFLGTNVDLPPQIAKYAKQGVFIARFLVRDSEGNEAVVSVHLDIGDQPPEVVSISNDTIISIKDSVPLHAKVRDLEGKVAWIGWDFENDGKFDDTLKTNDSTFDFKSGHRYPKQGTFFAMLRALDDNGKVRLDSVKVTVLLDPPVADAGKDTTVIAGTPVNFHAYGKDSLGAIAKRELKVGAGSFINLGKQDTTFKLPGDSGSVTCVVRVTDDDGSTDEDTMIVTIVAPDKSNNQLAGLVPSAGILAPSFKAVTIIYSLAVAYEDSQVTMTASTFDPSATLAINGKPTASGTPSDPVDVKVGTTVDVFKIVVTAQDGTQKVYSVSVTRNPSTDASLSKLDPVGFSLKPGFSPAVLDYADTVAFAVGSVTLKPTASHPAAKVMVNDTAVVSGAASKALPLVVGDNLIKVSVTAQDGKTKAAYNVKVVRRAKLILVRVAGAGNTSVTDSLEFPLGSTVPITTPDTVGFHFQKWTVTFGTGTLEDSLAKAGTLTLKSAVVRVLAVHVINVYKISTAISGYVGGIFDPTVINIQHGKDTSLTIKPLVGYRVFSLTDNGKPATLSETPGNFGPRTYTLTGVTEAHDLVATFLKTYTLTSSVTGTGTIVPLGTIEVDSGTTKAFTLTSGSPATGIILSSLVDSVEKKGSPDLGGDEMNISTYTLAGIKSNHTIAATFAVKTFQMKLTGHDLCYYQIVPCTGDPRFCLLHFCLAGSGPDTVTVTADYGTNWSVRTADSSVAKQPLINWNINGTLAGNTTNPQTISNVKSNQTVSAVYNVKVVPCCPNGFCCTIGGGPILTEPIQAAPSTSTVPEAITPPLPISKEN
ncbi:MAG: cell wall/surface repeat protein [Fibrobacteres bacterium]|nr:cell wall/surface repeat protein [Fibrobacterota bacterium]